LSVRYALLGLLSQHPCHGYELRAAFEVLAGGKDTWDVKPAQVYVTLERLEESGYVHREAVEKDGGPEKRIYSLTELGRDELNRWFSSGTVEEYQRDEFFVKLMLSLEDPMANPQRIIQIQRSMLYQELHQVTTQRQQADPRQELAQILRMDKMVMHLEADLRWLDMIEARLEEVKRQPKPQPEVRPRGRPPKNRP
jgi:DNA-binding PadR family transcriptional regulator